MNKLLTNFKNLFKEFGPNEDIINMYLVFMGIRSACLISNINLFYTMPKETKLEIYFEKYPNMSQTNYDYPLVCLKNSLVSKVINQHSNEFTEHELGLYLGFNCYNQDWKNIKTNRYSISYILNETKQKKLAFYNEVCSIQPDIGTILRIKFKAHEMSNALKIINSKYKVTYKIELLKKVKKN